MYRTLWVTRLHCPFPKTATHQSMWTPPTSSSATNPFTYTCHLQIICWLPKTVKFFTNELFETCDRIRKRDATWMHNNKEKEFSATGFLDTDIITVDACMVILPSRL